MKALKRHADLLPLAVVLLLAAALRVAWPGVTEFKFSEARMEALALEITREGHLPLVGVPSSAGIDHSPLSVYLYAPAFLLTTNPIGATIFGGLVNVMAVASCWWFASRWPGGSRTQAHLAALLLAVNPWAVLFSRKIWQITFVPILALAVFASAASALLCGRRWHLCWSLVAYAVLAQVHPSAIALLPALLLWLVLFWHRGLARPLLSGGVLGTLTAAPFLVRQAQTAWRVSTAIRDLSAHWDSASVRVAWNALTGQGIDALAGASHSQLRIVPELASLFSIGGWLLLASALALGWRAIRNWRASQPAVRQRARLDVMLLTWLAVPVLFNLRHSLDLQLHFYALSLPAACLITARGVDLVLSPMRGAPCPATRGRGLACACLWTALSILVAAQIAGLTLIGSFVATHDTKGGFGRPLGRYLELADLLVSRAESHHAAEVLVVGQGISPATDDLPAVFDVLLRGRYPYRFVDVSQSAVFPMYPAELLIAPGDREAGYWYDLWPAAELEDGFRLSALDGGWPQTGMTPISAPRLLQNGIELQAYEWPQQTGTSRLWLQWQVLWDVAYDTHFFVHLVDAQGTLLGHRDGDGYPVSGRKKGDRVLTAFDIIPDSAPSLLLNQEFWARIGMYEYPAVVNVPVIDSRGSPVASDVTVGPLRVQAGPQH